MALPQIADHFYVQAVFDRSTEDQVVNTFCFRNHRDIPGEAHDDPALIESMRDMLDSFYGTGASQADTIGGNLSPVMHSLRYLIYDLGQPNAGGVEVASDTFRTSATAGDQAPPDIALVVTWRTALRGRSYRGRTYIGPFTKSVLGNDGGPNAAQLDRVVQAVPKLIGDSVTRDWQICVLSRELGVATPVTSADVDLEFDTQRRRGKRAPGRVLISAP